MINEKYAKKYCKDDIRKIKNYEEAIKSDKMYDCHHILELTIDQDFAHSREDLKRLGMYWKRPYFELVFLESREHYLMHRVGKGRDNNIDVKSRNTRIKNGSSLGERNGMYGKPSPFRGKKHTIDTIELFKRKKKLYFENHDPAVKGNPFSEFGNLFKSKYGITFNENKKLYFQARRRWKRGEEI